MFLARIEALLAEMKELQRENESLSAKLSNIEAGNLVSKSKRNQWYTCFSCKSSGNRYE